MAHYASEQLMREAREWLHATPIDDDGQPIPDATSNTDQTLQIVDQIHETLKRNPAARFNLGGYDPHQRQLIMAMLAAHEQKQVYVSEMM